jgi:hypothetical protein
VLVLRMTSAPSRWQTYKVGWTDLKPRLHHHTLKLKFAPIDPSYQIHTIRFRPNFATARISIFPIGDLDETTIRCHTTTISTTKHMLMRQRGSRTLHTTRQHPRKPHQHMWIHVPNNNTQPHQHQAKQHTSKHITSNNKPPPPHPHQGPSRNRKTRNRRARRPLRLRSWKWRSSGPRIMSSSEDI